MTIAHAGPCALPGVHGVLTTHWGALHHHRRGVGSSLVLIHDLGSDQGSCTALASRLEAAHHVVTVDLLGHGGSDVEARDLSPAAQAGALAELIEELDMQRPVVLVGHGHGGAVAIEVAARWPRLVSHLVLIASGSFPHPPPWPWRCARFAPLWTLAGLFHGRALSRASNISWSAWHTLGRACRQMTSAGAIIEVEDLLERSVKVPTLFIWGSEDQVQPAAVARARALELGRPTFIEVAGGSHRVHEEQPDMVAELIEALLAR